MVVWNFGLKDLISDFSFGILSVTFSLVIALQYLRIYCVFSILTNLWSLWYLLLFILRILVICLSVLYSIIIMLSATNHVLRSIANPLKLFVRYKYPNLFNEYLRNLPQFQVSMLQNGLTVMTEERETCNACIGIYVDAGARYEALFENGVTHFFEHICFKGTNARPRAVLEQQMECTGAAFDCTTTRDMAGYRVRCLAENAPLCFDLLSDCVFNNSYCESVIAHERDVVAAEMRDHDHDPAALLDDYLHLTAFQGCPLEQTIMGPSSNLYNFDSMTISRYMNKFFDSRRTVVAVVGGVKHAQMVALAQTYLGKLEPSKCLDRDVYRFTASEIRYRNDDLPAALVALAVEAPCLCDEERLALEVACEVLGGWDTAQGAGRDHAWELARYASVDKLALAFRSFYLTYKDTGLFGVKFLSGRMELGNMQMAVQKVLLGLVHLITDTDVQRAKRVLKAKMLSRDLDVGEASAEAGRAMLYHGRRDGLAARVAAVDALNTQHVRDVCDRYLDDRKPVVSAVGPTEALDDYTRIASLMYWLRN